jgi:hypothetical protein
MSVLLTNKQKRSFKKRDLVFIRKFFKMNFALLKEITVIDSWQGYAGEIRTKIIFKKSEVNPEYEGGDSYQLLITGYRFCYQKKMRIT